MAYELTDDSAMLYTEAILSQAVEDWRYLCNGGTETKDRNFKELEEFFTVDCHIFLLPTTLLPEAIYAKLKKERADIERERQRKIKTMLNLIDGFVMGFPATNGG